MESTFMDSLQAYDTHDCDHTRCDTFIYFSQDLKEHGNIQHTFSAQIYLRLDAP